MKILLRIFLSVMLLSLVSVPAQANPFKELFEKGQRKYEAGEYEEAKKIFEKTLEVYPKFAPSYYYLGLCKRDLKMDAREVLSMFKKTVELDPTHFNAHDLLGKTYYALGDFDLAEQHTLKALELRPDLVTAKLSLAWIYLLGKDRPEDAAAYFQQVVDKFDVPYAYFGLGLSYVKMDDMAPVLEIITKLRKLNYDHLALQLERMMRAGRYLDPVGMNGEPLVAPPKRQEGPIITDLTGEISTIAYTQEEANMKVRLRPPSEIPVVSEPSSAGSYSSNADVTGEQRIKMLQEKNRKKALGY